MRTNSSTVALSAMPPGSRTRSTQTPAALRHYVCLAGVAMLLAAAPFGVTEAATDTAGAQDPAIWSAAPSPDWRASRPLVFEANRGQADAPVQFVARGAGYTALLTSTEMVLQLGTRATVHLKPVGTDPASFCG